MPVLRTVQQLAVLGVLAVMAVAGCGKAKPPTVVKVTQRAPDTVPIIIRSYPNGGGALKRREVNEQTVAEKIIDAGNGKPLSERKMKMSNEVVYTDHVEVPGDQQPKLMRRSYSLAMDRIENETRKLPYEGRTVVFEFKDGKYEASALGLPPLATEELAVLARRVSQPNLVQLYLPNKPVAEGESWTIDIAKAAPVIADGTDVDIRRSSGTGALTKVYMKPPQRSLFGVVEFNLKLAVVNRVFQGKQKLAWEPDTYLEFKGSIDTAIDGSTTEGTVNVKGKFYGKSKHFVMKDKNVAVESDTEFSSHQERSADK
jgi:hypothetical protein